MLSGINRDILLLIAKMNRVRKGDLQPFPNPPALGRDELGTLNRQFDKMTADFKQVIEENYIKQLLLTQTQLKALEQQINPHFLYIIHWKPSIGLPVWEKAEMCPLLPNPWVVCCGALFPKAKTSFL